MSHGDQRSLLRNPHGAARWLTTGVVVDGAAVLVAHRSNAVTVLDVVFEPPDELPAYPTEHVRVTIRADGKVYAVPVDGDRRTWTHRYPHLTPLELLRSDGAAIPWETILGPLCLEYPWDPQWLRWHWSDGIDAYLRIVQRHLWYEEYARHNNGEWPVEDTPHGGRDDGKPHPILTPEVRNAA